eukprot:TRINITY_DN43255_c0_g1_i1.p1 TRINITY_DN43255_c0_g1~~TRINITY_DN43255_c0_g1_i1.p1  ORF type:complete len:423 (-),score=67.49 TRINITY_DN43255_c0_g1_i1:85-1353(-)
MPRADRVDINDGFSLAGSPAKRLRGAAISVDPGEPRGGPAACSHSVTAPLPSQVRDACPAQGQKGHAITDADPRIPRLVSALKSGAGKARKHSAAFALDTLFIIASREEQQKHLVAAGTMPPLVETLKFGALRAAGKAAKVLAFLATGKEAEIIADGVLPFLFTLLNNHHAESQLAAVTLLAALARAPSACRSTLDIENLHQLFKVWCVGSVEAKAVAARAIARLAVLPDIGDLLLGIGVVPRLAAVLRSDDSGRDASKTKQFAALSLRNLSVCLPQKTEVAAMEHDCVPLLVSLLRNNVPTCVSPVAGTSEQTSEIEGKRMGDATARTNTVAWSDDEEHERLMLQDDQEVQQEKHLAALAAASALQMLARSPQVRVAAMAAGVAAPLAAFARSASSSPQAELVASPLMQLLGFEASDYVAA